MTMLSRSLAAAFVFLVAATGSAHAARMWLEEISGLGIFAVHVSGVIEPGDAKRFTGILRRPGVSGVREDIVSVVLNSPGGSLRDGSTMAAEVQIARLPVYVPADAICASACFIIAASSPKKSLVPSVGKGHSPCLSSTGERRIGTRVR